MKKCKLDINKVVKEKDKASLTAKQLWYKKRNYCLQECKQCAELDMLKKIYWELRKQK